MWLRLQLGECVEVASGSGREYRVQRRICEARSDVGLSHEVSLMQTRSRSHDPKSLGQALLLLKGCRHTDHLLEESLLLKIPSVCRARTTLLAEADKIGGL